MDVGSNAIRYSLAEFADVSRRVELESQRFAVRLGQDAFTTRVLSPPVLDAAVGAAVRFRQRLDDLGIVGYRAVATSAVRESRNGGELVDRVRRESGIHLETITGGEEARLVWLAVRQSVPLDDASWLLADLGGGSIELSRIDESGIRASETHPLGTVRLLADLSSETRDPEEFRSLLERYLARLQVPEGDEREVAGTIITGGNAEALSDITGAQLNSAGVREICAEDLRVALERLAGMTISERIRDLGLRDDRADVILPAAVVFDRVVKLVESDRILIPRVGVKDGVLIDLAENFGEHVAHESEMDRTVTAAALSIGRRYRFEESHALHVRDLALSLFDQLAWLHELGEAHRRQLRVAALLHDIGQFVSERKHHKHSWYLISNSEMPGLSEDETRIVALIARYHRRSEPRDDHEGFRDLSQDDRQAVRKLAGILRVADALDHEHRQHVRSVVAKQEGDCIVLTLETEGDTSLEDWAVEKKSSLFERAFSASLRLD